MKFCFYVYGASSLQFIHGFSFTCRFISLVPLCSLYEEASSHCRCLTTAQHAIIIPLSSFERSFRLQVGGIKWSFRNCRSSNFIPASISNQGTYLNFKYRFRNPRISWLRHVDVIPQLRGCAYCQDSGLQDSNMRLTESMSLKISGAMHGVGYTWRDSKLDCVVDARWAHLWPDSGAGSELVHHALTLPFVGIKLCWAARTHTPHTHYFHIILTQNPQ